VSGAFWKGSETYHIIQAMKATGNRPGVIAQWKADVERWARFNYQNPDAVAVNAWLPLWQPRPFYTAEELMPLWPALAIATGFTDKWPSVLKSAKRLGHELDFFGLPRLDLEYRQYFIVERIHHWRRATKQEIMREIENVLG
jgi:hypothetical protein